MKRSLFILMFCTGVFLVAAGIIESQSWHGGKPGAHIAAAVLFLILCVVNIVVQRKAVWRYVTGAAKLPSDPRQKRRQIMRRVTVYLMLVFGLLTFISALAEDGAAGVPAFHVTMASIFILFFARHVLANRKAVLRYFSSGPPEPAAAPPSRSEQDAAD